MCYNMSLYRDAILDDGSFVLKQVVTQLYEGGKLRPDIYVKKDDRLLQKYNRAFTNDQRQTIMSSGHPTCYDIEMGTSHFDISILCPLAEHACGLSSSDILMKKVFEVKRLRNNVCHTVGEEFITKSVLTDKLDDLLELYDTILNYVESHGSCNLFSEKIEVRRRILNKKSKAQNTSQTLVRQQPPFVFVDSPRETSSPRFTIARCDNSDSDDDSFSWPSRTTSSSSRSYGSANRSSDSEIPTWGKIALGVTAGIAALGVVGAVAHEATKDKSSEQKKREQKEEECAIM